MTFAYFRTVNFYETDSMRIVHHSNYIRYLEETRIAWAKARGLIDFQDVQAASQFAVLDCHIRYLKPALFAEELQIFIQAKASGPKIIFEYKVCSKTRQPLLLAEARTVHANVNEQLRAQRPSEKLKQLMEKEQWTETWLLNL